MADFLCKGADSTMVCHRLCQADVFPTKTDDELSEAIVMMSPCLSKYSRDGQFCDKTCNHWLSDEIIREVDKIKDFDECEKLFCRQKKRIEDERKSTLSTRPPEEKTTSKERIGLKRPLPSTNTHSVSSVTNKSKKKQIRGKMNVTPTLRQQHQKESSVMGSCSRCTSPVKTTKDESSAKTTKDEFSVLGSCSRRTSLAKRTKKEFTLIHEAKNHDCTKDEVDNESLIFDELEDGSSHALLPTIVVETCQEKTNNKLVRGPKGKQGDPSCFSNNRKDRLSMVLSCPTTGAHMHCFSMAHARPHFVISEQNSPTHFSRVVAAQSGMPKMLLHSRHCLSSPMIVNNIDGSLNFHLFSNQTEEFSNHFSSIKTDFHWWMQTFDKLEKKKTDDRGFSEMTDLGWARHGCSESASTSQNRSKNVVCALPKMINKSKSDEFQNITGLLDQMTDFMDNNFLDNGCKLFNDPLRDEQFAGRLRSMHGGEKFRAEAFTIVRQQLGTIQDVMEGECNFKPTEHHM